MSHISHRAQDKGAFDIEAAERVAVDIIEARYGPTEYETSAARYVVDPSTHEKIMGQIDYMSFLDNDPRQLRTRIYAQLLGDVSTNFIGLKPHFDIDRENGNRPFDFTFAFSAHPPQVVIGTLDFDAQTGLVGEHVVLDPQTRELEERQLQGFAIVPQAVIDTAVERTAAWMQEDVHPGVIFQLGVGCIHYMSSLEGVESSPPRLCVEQYLMPR